MSTAAPPPPPKTAMPGHIDVHGRRTGHDRPRASHLQQPQQQEQQSPNQHQHQRQHQHHHHLPPDHRPIQQRSVLHRSREHYLPGSPPHVEQPGPGHPRAHVSHHHQPVAAAQIGAGAITSHPQDSAQPLPPANPTPADVLTDSSDTANPEEIPPQGPSQGKGALLSRLRRTLVSRAPLARTWEKASFAEECRSAPAMLYGGGAGREQGAGEVTPGNSEAEVLAERSERTISRDAANLSRPSSLYASPAALRAFRPLPPLSSPTTPLPMGRVGGMGVDPQRQTGYAYEPVSLNPSPERVGGGVVR